ncbi:MAG: hypothetical protein K5666_03710, partial [Bacilli bacterium]|nr:hypothetical protein [Bacilli bacterium]
YDYYLYVDLVSYYNKADLSYSASDGYYLSKTFADNKGIINITKLESRYLISLEYNYAKIEVLVKEKDINMAISNSIIICSSISYNDDTIKAIFDEGVLSTNEKTINVFKTNDEQNRNLLELEDDSFTYEPAKDRDYIN